jgi:hypothetical protein
MARLTDKGQLARRIDWGPFTLWQSREDLLALLKALPFRSFDSDSPEQFECPAIMRETLLLLNGRLKSGLC